MRKRLHKGLWICLLIVCVYVMGTQSVLSVAAEQISERITSLRYDLEITEPILEEYADGSGMFRANAVCADRVVGTEIQVVVAFYDSKDEMLECWIASQTLTEQGQINLSGTVPDYASVSVNFFEGDSLNPICPTVQHLMEQQKTDGNTKELISALEKRIKAHDHAIRQLEQELDSLLNGFSGNVLLSRNYGQRTVTDGGAGNQTSNVRTTITGFTTYMTKDVMFGDADSIEGLILNDFRIEKVEGFGQVELEIQFRNFDSSLTKNVVSKSILVKSYVVPVTPNGLDNYQVVVPIRRSDLAELNDEFLLGMRIISAGSVVRMEFSHNTTAVIHAKNSEKLTDDPGWCKYAGYYTSKATPTSSRQALSPDIIFSTVKTRDVSNMVDHTLTKSGSAADAAAVGDALSELTDNVGRLGHALEDTVLVEQKEFFNSGKITGKEGIGTIDMNGFGFIILKEWLTEDVSGVRVNLYLNGKTDMPVTCEVLNSNKQVINNLSVTDTLSADGEHIFDISFGADDIEEDFCYLAIYNADRENGYWLGFSTIDTSSEWYQKTSTSGIPPIYMYGTQKTWIRPTSYPKRYFALLFDVTTTVEREDIATKEYIDEKLSESRTSSSYDMIQAAEEYIAVEGDTLEIFYKSILHAKNPLNYTIHASCAVGTGYQEKFVVPSTVTAGVYPLVLTVTNNRGELIDQETININVQKKAQSPKKTVNVLCMGASTESDGLWINEFYRRLTQTSSVAVTGAEGPTGDGLSNIRFIGKRTTNLGAGYEGFGGWSWGSYISTTSSSGSYWVKVSAHSKTASDQESIYKDANGVLWQLETIESTQLKMKKYGDTSGTMPASGTLTYHSGGVDSSDIVFKSATPETGNPFCYDGKLDFKAYCADIGAEGIDYVYAKLVWNGTPNGTYVTQASLEKRAAQIRTFLTALLADYPDAKLVLTSSPIPSYDGCGTNYTADSVFQNWWYLRDWMYKHQSVIYPMLKEEFPDNIYFCDISAQFDIDHGYPTTTVPYNTRTSQAYKRQSNGVHPTNEGRMQWSDAAYRHFTQMLNSQAEQENGGDNSCATGHNYEVIVTAPNCAERGYTTHICVCGDSYVDTYVDALGHSYHTDVDHQNAAECEYCVYTEPAAKEPGSFVRYCIYGCGTTTVEEISFGTIEPGQWRMNLDSVIYLNYYPKLTGFPDDFDFQNRGGVVIWTGKNDPTSRTQIEVGKENTVNLPGMRRNQNGEWYVRTHEIYAKNLGDTVYIRPYIIDGNGDYVYLDGAPYYSPATFCYDILNDLKEPEGKRYVCAALLEYGAAAQKYFGYDTGNLVTTIPTTFANIDLSSYDLAYYAGYRDPMDITDHVRMLAGTLDDVECEYNKVGVSYDRSVLGLAGAIRLSVGFNIDTDVIDPDQVAKAEVMFWSEKDIAKVDSLVYSLENYTYKCNLEKSSSGGIYIGDYRAQSHYIVAKYLGDMVYFTCRIEMKDGTAYNSGLGYYSPEAFAGDHIDYSAGQIVDLCERIIVYSEMAYNWFVKGE